MKCSEGPGNISRILWRGAYLSPWVEPETVDLVIINSSPTLGVEIILKQNLKKNSVKMKLIWLTCYVKLHGKYSNK